MWRKIKKILGDRENQKKYAVWLLQQVIPYRKQILTLLCVRCALAFLGVSSAVINKYIVDRAVASMGMAASIAAAVGVSAVSLVLSAFAGLYLNTLNEKFSFHTRTAVYKNLMKSGWEEVQKYHSEDILTRLTSDVSAVTNGIVNVFLTLITLLFQLILAFFLLFHYDWRLAMFIIILSPPAALCSAVFGIRMREHQIKYQEAEARYRVYLQEHISKLSVIKAFSFEDQSAEGLDNLRKERLYWLKKKTRCSVAANTCLSAAFSGGYLFAFISGAFRIASGAITYGTLTAFLSLVNQIQTPMLGIVGLLPQAAGVLASAGRIMEIDGLAKEEKTGKGKSSQAEKAFGIRGTQIWFSYQEKKPVFRNLNFDIKPGSITAVMGPSGAGKTTLIRMLLGFLKPERGALEYYDLEGNLWNCSPDARQWLSYVPQGNTLFSGTIEENLKIGNPQAGEQEMRKALEAACAWEFVDQQPQKMRTYLGEKASGLSEGQAQRIAIARAFLAPAAVLILDEATSALDEGTEEDILKCLKTWPQKPTCFVVSHRSTVRKYADQTIMLAGNYENLEESE